MIDINHLNKNRSFMRILLVVLFFHLNLILFVGFTNCGQTGIIFMEDRGVVQAASTLDVPIATPVCAPNLPEDFKPMEAFRWDWANSTSPDFNQVMSAPMVGDIDGDGKPEIVFNSFNRNGNYRSAGVLRVLSGTDGREVFSLSDLDIAPRGDTHTLLVDIDGDGKSEIFYVRHQEKELISLNFNGTLRWRISLLHPVDDCIGGPAAIDFENRGKADIIVENMIIREDEMKRVTIREVGPYVPSSCTTFGMTVDSKNSSKAQLITGAGVFAYDGTSIFTLPPFSDGRGRRLAAADVDRDHPGIELVVSEGGKIEVYNIEEKKLLWERVVPVDETRFKGTNSNAGPPNISDVDGDGYPDITVAGSTYYVAFDRFGNEIWKDKTNDYSSQITGSSVFDFNGDGITEVLYADEGYFRIYSGPKGNKLFEFRNPSATHLEYPVVADVDGDGTADLIVAANDYGNSAAAWTTPEEAALIKATATGVRVFKSKGKKWVKTRPVWNQYSYFGSNVTDHLKAVASTPVLGLMAQSFFRQNTYQKLPTGCTQ